MGPDLSQGSNCVSLRYAFDIRVAPLDSQVAKTAKCEIHASGHARTVLGRSMALSHCCRYAKVRRRDTSRDKSAMQDDTKEFPVGHEIIVAYNY